MPEPNRRALRTNATAAVVGNVLEWYDFAVYAFLAPIIGRLFFPADDPVASLLAAFGVFAVGYAVRPIGGAIFGHIGDRIGRKPAMLVSIVVMGVATFAIGVLPDHAAIGPWAAAVLLILRIVQGLSIGGEYTGSIVFLAEHAPPARRGFYSAWPQFGCVGGFILGSALGSAISGALGDDAMLAWGWRIPFLIGAVIAVIGIFYRRRLTEPQVALEAERRLRAPVWVAFRDHWRPILRLVGIILPSGAGFYLVFVYAAAYLTEQMHVSTSRALEISTFSLLAMLIATIPLAMLADRIGRRKQLIAVAIAGIVFSWPMWWLIHQNSFALILAGQIGLALIFSGTLAILPAVMAEMLPTEVRCSGAALAYNICVGIFGGTTPLVATWLVARTADDLAPIYLIVAAAVIQLVAVLGMREMAGKPLSSGRNPI